MTTARGDGFGGVDRSLAYAEVDGAKGGHLATAVALIVGVVLAQLAPVVSAPAFPSARRGSLATALEVAGSAAAMASAEASYQQDKYAASSHASRAAWLHT